MSTIAESNAESTFIFDGHEVRIIRAEGNEPRFVVADIADALGYPEANKLTRTLDEDEQTEFVRRHSAGTLGGSQNVSVISEEGLNLILMRLRSERVKPFQRWIACEVLPSIRKTGGYQAAESAPRDITLTTTTTTTTTAVIPPDVAAAVLPAVFGAKASPIRPTSETALPASVEAKALAQPEDKEAPKQARKRFGAWTTAQTLGAVLPSRGQRRYFTNRLLALAKALPDHLETERIRRSNTYRVRATKTGRVYIDGLIAQALTYVPKTKKPAEAN